MGLHFVLSFLMVSSEPASSGHEDRAEPRGSRGEMYRLLCYNRTS